MRHGSHRPSAGLDRWFSSQIENLDPGCFAQVMATGVISSALLLMGFSEVSIVMFDINLVVYLWLFILTLLRSLCFPSRLWADLIDPRRSFAFFTLVAATNVVAIRLDLPDQTFVPLTLWLSAFSLWLFLIYFCFAVVAFTNTSKGADIVHGGWIVAIVATQSLVILGQLIAARLGPLGSAMLVLAHILWGLGLGLYGVFIVLLCNRILYFPLALEDITPALWIVMGAAAITANAGSVLVLANPDLPYLQHMQPFVDGVTLLMWAWATWWIFFLLLLAAWKHLVWRAPITYAPMLWSLVFPIGMYALANLRLSLAAHFAVLQSASRVIVWIALSVWIVTTAGLIKTLWRSIWSPS